MASVFWSEVISVSATSSSLAPVVTTSSSRSTSRRSASPCRSACAASSGEWAGSFACSAMVSSTSGRGGRKFSFEESLYGLRPSTCGGGLPGRQGGKGSRSDSSRGGGVVGGILRLFGHGREHLGQGREEVLVRGELVRSQTLDLPRRFARHIGREGVQSGPQAGRRGGGGCGIGNGHGLMMSQPSHQG